MLKSGPKTLKCASKRGDIGPIPTLTSNSKFILEKELVSQQIPSFSELFDSEKVNRNSGSNQA